MMICGAPSRTLFTGLSIGTLFTLFVVPAMYMFIGADHGHEHRAAQSGEGQGGDATPAPTP
jgi:multidrug efflux pump